MPAGFGGHALQLRIEAQRLLEAGGLRQPGWQNEGGQQHAADQGGGVLRGNCIGA